VQEVTCISVRFARPKYPRKLTSEVIAGMTET